MSQINNINLILHAHLPYVRHLEYERFLEEDWFYESLNESYLPLFRMLTRLDNAGVDFKLSFCFSPTLLTMLRDEQLTRRFKNYMDLHIELGRKEVVRLKDSPEERRLAEHYLEELLNNWEFYEKNGMSLIPVVSMLASKGKIELFTTAATHAIFPSTGIILLQLMRR